MKKITSNVRIWFMLLLYFDIFLFFCCGMVIGVVPILLGFFFGPKTEEKSKVSPYECGFEVFGDARFNVNVRFYLVAILFIIFDLEVVFLFPWAMILWIVKPIGFFCFLLFLFILTLGFIYEWQRGALEWE
jgi:NADH-quinone oxidoreductase subunit A